MDPSRLLVYVLIITVWEQTLLLFFVAKIFVAKIRSQVTLMGRDIGTQHDPIAETKATLIGEDLRYWAAHPEVPALVSHLMAKGRK